MKAIADVLFWAALTVGLLVIIAVAGFRLLEDWRERRRTAPWRNPEAFRRALRRLAAHAQGQRR